MMVIEGDARQRGFSLTVGVAVFNITTQAWPTDKRKEGAAVTVMTVCPFIGFQDGFFFSLSFLSSTNCPMQGVRDKKFRRM